MLIIILGEYDFSSTPDLSLTPTLFEEFPKRAQQLMKLIYNYVVAGGKSVQKKRTTASDGKQSYQNWRLNLLINKT